MEDSERTLSARLLDLTGVSLERLEELCQPPADAGAPDDSAGTAESDRSVLAEAVHRVLREGREGLETIVVGHDTNLL